MHQGIRRTRMCEIIRTRVDRARYTDIRSVVAGGNTPAIMTAVSQPLLVAHAHDIGEVDGIVIAARWNVYDCVLHVVEAELTTRHRRLFHSPVVIADRTPAAVMEDLEAAI